MFYDFLGKFDSSIKSASTSSSFLSEESVNESKFALNSSNSYYS